MRLNKINIENFKCFEHYEISLAKQTTVFIGKNGTGKTSLITAIKKGLSFIFAKSQNYPKSLSESNNCNIRSFSLWDARFDDIQRIFSLPIKNDFSAVYNDQIIEWTTLKKKDPGSLHSTLYKEALDKILSVYNADLRYSNLPLVAYFSDSYPHVTINIGEKASKIAKMDVLPRDFAYYGWDEETNCAELWQRRYIKVCNFIRDRDDDIAVRKSQINLSTFLQENSRKKEDQIIHQERTQALRAQLEQLLSNDELYEAFKRERDFIETKITLFTAPVRNDLPPINKEFQINQIRINRPDKKTSIIEFSFENGRTMHFDILPAGYRRLLSIVFDIAYRSYILNEDRPTQGIVIIDEIELHLHLTLQQDVLERLHKTFPSLQFIISTHSPLVVSNLMADGEQHKIIQLSNNGLIYTNKTLENVYGIDYATNLTEVMESGYRASTIDKFINIYLSLYGKNRENDANKILDKLRDYLGGSIPNLLQEEINEQKKAYR